MPLGHKALRKLRGRGPVEAIRRQGGAPFFFGADGPGRVLVHDTGNFPTHLPQRNIYQSTGSDPPSPIQDTCNLFLFC